MPLVAVMVMVLEQDKADITQHLCRFLLNRRRGTLFLWHMVGNVLVCSLCVSLAGDAANVKHQGPDFSTLSR